ncbi:MAG: YCF48-related protein, partial [Bacteroidota bacterium]|nr:YCF48-related protein [Bacteroidota bacterium]MDX5430934.1 YCF48-related protein [Bacteroidota bacterium]MDX5469682.1 YCF48-related protein [Bacteroidota bacterium]
MKPISIFLLVFSFLLASQSQSQSYRGIHALNDTVCWVSGSHGTVIKTVDGGEHWDTISPLGYGQKEFRDIHVYNLNTAVVMSSGDSAVILKTTDGGLNWRVVHSNMRPGVFYDAMDVLGPFMVIVGDPFKIEALGIQQFDLI